jgi:hypothetical protein
LGSRIMAALVAFFTIVAGIIAFLQYMSPAQPIIITVPTPVPAPPPARSDAEAERILERARGETLEKAPKDTAAARPAPDAPATAPPAGKPSAVEEPAPPKIAASTPPPQAKPCIPVGNRIERPIPVSVGTQLCPTPDGVRATIHDITSFGVVYSVPGWKRETCQRSETCTFYWDGAPQFSIDVVEDADGRHAVLVGAR